MNYRSHRSRNYVVGLLATAVGLLAASPAFAGSWQDGFNFGTGALQGDLYTPSTLGKPPAILVAIHMCGGMSSVVHGWFDSYADTTGFYIIAPQAPNKCFDASASRDGDKAGVVAMVNYLITNKGADKTRVFATGMSSGGCMTNTLLAIYPDVFAGGSAMPGFPAGGWPAGDTICTKCGSQPPSMTGAQWAALATNVFKWSGQYGCSQQWVGGGDQYNFDGWLPTVVLQMQTLGDLGAAVSEASWSDHPGWTRTIYKDGSGNVRLETNLGPTSQMHDLETVSPKLYLDVITFLGLDKTSGACGLSTTSTTGGGGTTGTGGTTSTGGTTGAGGAAGAKGTGGAGGAAGAKGTGGVTSTGGVTGTGGEATGGTTGGTTGTGGEATGGTTGTGGVKGTGGTTGTGGEATGGTTGTGGQVTSGEGGTSQTGGTGGDDSSSSSGCSCALGSGATGGGPLGLLVGLALTLARRRRRTGSGR